MSGGDDIQAGRWNTAETTTVLAGGRPTNLGADFNGTAVLRVVSETGAIHPNGRLDAIVGVGFSGGTGLTGFGAGGGNGVLGLGSAGGGTFLAAAGIVATGGLSTSGTPTTANRSPHGAGLVATAGSSVQPTIPSETGNVGVFGQGGDQVDETKNVGGSNFIVGPGFAGAGVVGRGGVKTTNNPDPTIPDEPNGPLTTAADGGSAGIVGIAGGTKTPTPGEFVNIGVFGTSDSGAGVRGHSKEGTGVVGASSQGVGVFGSSVDDRAAVFHSFNLAQLNLKPLVKVPANLDLAPQVRGRPGDLLVTIVPDVEAQGNVDIAELWFCNLVNQGGVTNWVKLG
jgi:hypothetical protein